MRLQEFILENMEAILKEWENFAREIQPPSGDMNVLELRDHAEDMLKIIAADMTTRQTEQQRHDKSEGNKPRLRNETAAEHHAEERLKAGFTIDLLVAEYRALRASVLHLCFQDGKCDGLGDIEGMIRFNEAIDQAVAESVSRYADATTMAQDVFLGILGHDLRAPLQSIGTGAQYLMHADLGNDISRLGTRMFNSVMRMNGMLDNLLDFTQSRISGLHINPIETDLAEVSDQVVAEFRLSNPDRCIRNHIIGNCQGRFDAGRIGQVYQNLISNALQYGAPDHDVAVTTQGNMEEIVLEVHNDGPPIPEAEQQYMFDLLQRNAQHPQAAGRHKNLGLGLYIAREIVTAHQGAIAVTSTKAEGTTFRVRLPKNS